MGLERYQTRSLVPECKRGRLAEAAPFLWNQLGQNRAALRPPRTPAYFFWLFSYKVKEGMSQAARRRSSKTPRSTSVSFFT